MGQATRRAMNQGVAGKLTYQEPHLSVLVLDYAKPIESRLCLESVKRHVKVPHAVVFCDNGGGEDYPIQFVREGLVDQLIVNRHSRGLGLGTRDLFALSPGRLALYLQNDQCLVADLTEESLNALCVPMYQGQPKVVSVSLAGAPCGRGVYSERAHLIETNLYQNIERAGDLGYHGAGPYHDGPWREEQTQALYTRQGWTHHTDHPPLVRDNGVYAVRDMAAGGLFVHRTDTKQMWVIRKPDDILTFNPAYPKLMEEEKAFLMVQGWPDGRVPLLEQDTSFHCWDDTPLGRMQDAYIADLRRRVEAQHRV